MTKDEARAIVAEANKQIDWYNLGTVLDALGDQGYAWGKFHNGRWRPNYTKAEQETKWLKKNFSDLLEALDTLRKMK